MQDAGEEGSPQEPQDGVHIVQVLVLSRASQLESLDPTRAALDIQHSMFCKF